MYVTVEQYNALVMQFQKDVNALQHAINKVALENGGLKTELATVKAQLAAQQNGKVYPNGNPAAPQVVNGDVIVGRHPITGQPVTKAQMESDSKLRRTMQFAEEDA
jgi:hypothetical protein